MSFRSNVALFGAQDSSFVYKMLSGQLDKPKEDLLLPKVSSENLAKKIQEEVPLDSTFRRLPGRISLLNKGSCLETADAAASLALED